MALPTDFDSFRMGVNLTAANYSGGAGGTFTDLVQGAGFWTVDGATPSFETRAGLEGMLFTGSTTESVLADMLCLHECTILAIGECATSSQIALYGGSLASANTWYGGTNANRLFTFASPNSVNTVADAAAATAPTVFVSSWSPKEATLYAQINDGAVASAVSDGVYTRIGWPEIAIGRHRISAFSGWIARVLVFDRALHARDPSGLASLVATEMASVGI